MAKKTKMTLERLAALLVESIDELRGQMVTGFESVRGDVAALQTDMTEVKRDVGEIKIDTSAHGKAIDKDSVTLIDHESRLQNLEPAR